MSRKLYKDLDHLILKTFSNYNWLILKVTICSQRTEERYHKRSMEQRHSFFILIFDWENDTFVLEYNKRIEGWKLQHESSTKVCICGMNQLRVKHYMYM